MVANPTAMEIIKQILNLHKKGRGGKREIARLLNLDSNTVKSI